MGVLRLSYMGFKRLAAETSPALAAFGGRRKYGSRRFDAAAARGESLRGVRPVRRARRRSY